MSYAGSTVAATTATQNGSYRVKFDREDFLQLVKEAKPERIYHVNRIFFFAFDGFVMYSFKCRSEDFPSQRILHAIEFSNTYWAE